MNTMNKIAILALFALLVAMPFAQAKEVTFRFSATITDVFDNLGIAGVQVGDQYDGSYTFDDTTSGVPRSPLGADYFDAITDLQISIGNFEVGLDLSGVGNVNNIRVNEEGSNPPRDSYQVETPPDAIEFCFAEFGGNFFVIDIQALSPSDLINGSFLPSTPPDLSLADVRRLIVLQSAVCVGNTDGFVDIKGVITSLELDRVSVDIDIKPGSDPNCFNVNGHGVIPVAILGSSTFDVTLVDTSTLLFGGLEVRMRGNKGPLCNFEDSDGDTILDLVCHFEDDSASWAPGVDDATLLGTLLDTTTDFEGTDSICVVP